MNAGAQLTANAMRNLLLYFAIAVAFLAATLAVAILGKELSFARV